MKNLFLVAMLAIAAAFMPTNAHAGCPTTTTYVGKTSDTNPPVTFKTTYVANDTGEIDFYLEVTWKNTNWSGNHDMTLFVTMPSGFAYQNFYTTINPSGGTAITCGKRFLLGSMPVAGTMIQTSQIYGAWTAEAWDSLLGRVATYNFSITAS
jgi:hypothetical protein